VAVRKAAGQVWIDKSLTEFPVNDFRIFVGDLSVEVTDALLKRTFEHYKSLTHVRIVRDTRTGKNKGYGFISFTDWEEGQRALKEMNGKYCGVRPMMLRKSDWQKRAAHK
jgi:RNA recognition motif-containing protein